MATHSTRFQVEFTTDGEGNVRAKLLSVSNAVEESGRKAAQAGDEWYEFGQKLGTSIRWAGVAVAAGIGLILRNTAQASQEIPQLEAVLRSTGNTSAKLRDQLVALAEDMSRRSIFSTGEIIEAETRLLSYSGILGENLPRAMQATIDQSARLGISLTQSAEVIGRALESPTKAAGALAQQGFGAAFTAEVRAQIKALEQAGRAGEAQRVILEILEESYEGAAQAARDSFGGALQALMNTLEDLTTGQGGSLDHANRSVNQLIDLLQDRATRDAFDRITSGALELTAALAQLIVKGTQAWETLNRFALNQVGGHSKLLGGEHIAAQRAELAQIEAEQRKRAQDDAMMQRSVLTGGWLATRAGIVSGYPLSLVGIQSINRSTDRDLEKRAAALRQQIELNELLFGDPSKPQVTIIDNGQPLPESVLGLQTNGGGGTPDPDRDAARRAERIARALAAAKAAAADWQRDLDSQANPILDRYADRLAKVQEQAQRMAKAGVPTDKIKAFTDEMTALAEQLRDKELAEWQREYTRETELMAAAMGGPGVEAATRYAQAMEELRRQQANGLVTAEMAAERERAYAAERDRAATQLIRALQEEREALGLNVVDLEVYRNLKAAGVSASSDLGQAIIQLTRQLQREREAIGAIYDTADAFHDLGAAVLANTSRAGDAFDQFAERVRRIAANLVMDRVIQMTLGPLLGGLAGGGGYTGNGTDAGSVRGFGNNLDNFTGNPYAGLSSGMRATGGGVRGSGIYEVTEYGKPELLRTGNRFWLMPGQDGVVMPAREAGAAGGAGPGALVIRFEVENNTNAEVRAVEPTMGADGAITFRAIVDTVRSDIERNILAGGSTARAIQQTFDGLRRRGAAA